MPATVSKCIAEWSLGRGAARRLGSVQLLAPALLAILSAGCGGSGSPTGAPAPTAPAPPEAPFVSFESSATQPIAVSADGLRLFVLQPVGGTLSIFSLQDPSHPVLRSQVRVGLEPVAVAERVPGEVWVANQLSDSVSVVDVDQGRVIDTVQVGDQPSDVVFAGGLAFVTLATEDRVAVLDGASRALSAMIDVPAEEPRALAVGDNGQSVWVLVRRSGNGTTILPASLAPEQPLPDDPNLPHPPHTGAIVRADDPAWQDAFSYSLPDRDLFRIDVAGLTIEPVATALGTTLFDLAVDPLGPTVWVAGTEARNTIAFEQQLRARAIEHRIVAVDSASGDVKATVDLNQGVEVDLLPDPASLAVALAEPTGLAYEPATRRLWLAAQGTDRVASIDVDSGAISARVELGSPGDTTVDRRGPRALALHPGGNWLYVYNGLSDTFSVVDVQSATVALEQPVSSRDPMPAATRAGRKFLFDARLSGNGTMSCASCHVDAETDGLAWNLGDPAGELFEVPIELQQGAIPGVAPPVFPPLHPMKGPLVTQSLRGLIEPLHWRGDKPAFEDFNGAFDSLLGGHELADGDMALFADWARSVRHAPNPHQQLDRSLPTTPPDANAATGSEIFHDTSVDGSSCIDCHALPEGSTGFISLLAMSSPQPMRVPPLFDYYRKDGFDPDATGPLASGFGRFSDGRVGDLVELAGVQDLFAADVGGSPHVDAFLRQLDTGTAPATGREVELDLLSATEPEAVALRALLIERAGLGEIALVAHGRIEGAPRTLLYDAEAQLWSLDTELDEPLTTAQLEGLAAADGADLVWTAVAPQLGPVCSVDADFDGQLDGDVAAVLVGTPTPAACHVRPRLSASTLPRVGQKLFSVVVDGVAPSSVGSLLVSSTLGSTPVGELQLLVGLDTPPLELVLLADALGAVSVAFPIPDDPAWVGAVMVFQAVWSAPACSGGMAASAALVATVAP
ncbi:beta-propeller fold lactonase family protein [Engelhardtia mirabilis]|uniref:Lactonase, 7-bladed beta-propeller n=1 Tax=Engelhardtia mirabilis TaxID=2528011 RepID=A0A518BGP2_9BACT|nr:Lactonase, 7-bladed beta-propeller [Planctomycetes bacterium Pla133]QDV00451.1 Lactonase, 7-bladed beta-propeller [Planctomycetes bacterium Pla86]